MPKINNNFDYLIIGSGLFGATFAREMTDYGKRCLVIERRKHTGGNVYCERVENITVHKYGAHIFHTDNETVWRYVNRFADFLPYIHRVSAKSGGETYSMPFNMFTFQKLWGVSTESEARERLRVDGAGADTEPVNLEEQAVALVGRELFEKLICGYTEKQWGRPCRELPASIIRRIPLRFTFDDRYFADSFQGIPVGGYGTLIDGLLKDIPVITSVEFRNYSREQPNIAEKILCTGPIDEYFDYRLGALEYRSLRFEEQVLNLPDFQGQPVINECDAAVPWTRTIEHKHFSGETSPVTVITREYPESWVPGKPAYYPVNDEKNSRLYQKYLELAKAQGNIIFGGRLGSYKYYDMDDAIFAALKLAEKEFQ